MKTCLITGVGGLIGSEAAEFFIKKGYSVIGIDNNMRKYFFGKKASTKWRIEELEENYYDLDFINFNCDICNQNQINQIFKEFSIDIEIIIHAAAQPSHDWAATNPLHDFDINAQGTLNLLEATRKYCPKASFVFCSTNKVYGDNPNKLNLHEFKTRYDLSHSSRFYHGINETFSVDNCIHSLFGCSKLSADMYVQEYGKNFEMKTVSFRGGCLTGTKHSSAELHGFLSYLVKCIVHGKSYTVFGRGGKTVRDNIDSYDVVSAFWEYIKNPGHGEVYNIGGNRENNISILEAIDKIEILSDKKAIIEFSDKARVGDHIWYISDMTKFKSHYPNWKITKNIDYILSEMIKTELKKKEF